MDLKARLYSKIGNHCHHGLVILIKPVCNSRTSYLKVKLHLALLDANYLIVITLVAMLVNDYDVRRVAGVLTVRH